ncbi:MAG: chemotaxis protein CheD [Planctomycetes bacterium]|nr:chemotaxis protein CheD [Planctomycetota bacterium]
MANLTVGISDAKISTDPDSVLVTHALGSCIGVTIYDLIKKLGGLLHFQLPQSRKNDASSQGNPFKYADTGFAVLFDELKSLGAQKNRIKVKLVGGAHKLSSGNDSFNIGKRNYAAIRQALWKNGLFIETEDVGGNKPRTMYFKISEGNVTIKSPGVTMKTI